MKKKTSKKKYKHWLIKSYNRLYDHFGPRKWWPAKTKFEIVVGAILTQNTSWKNVEKAICNLKIQRLLNPERMYKTKNRRLMKAVKPSGFYKIKTERLKSFLRYFKKYSFSFNRIACVSTSDLRSELLNIKGIGPETADSILLYVFNRPVFVIDTYTRRILIRHGFKEAAKEYSELQKFFHDNMPPKPAVFNEFHALIVEVGKNFCKSAKAFCADCPLNRC